MFILNRTHELNTSIPKSIHYHFLNVNHLSIRASIKHVFSHVINTKMDAYIITAVEKLQQMRNCKTPNTSFV